MGCGVDEGGVPVLGSAPQRGGDGAPSLLAQSPVSEEEEEEGCCAAAAAGGCKGLVLPDRKAGGGIPKTGWALPCAAPYISP